MKYLLTPIIVVFPILVFCQDAIGVGIAYNIPNTSLREFIRPHIGYELNYTSKGRGYTISNYSLFYHQFPTKENEFIIEEGSYGEVYYDIGKNWELYGLGAGIGWFLNRKGIVRFYGMLDVYVGFGNREIVKDTYGQGGGYTITGGIFKAGIVPKLGCDIAFDRFEIAPEVRYSWNIGDQDFIVGDGYIGMIDPFYQFVLKLSYSL